MAKKYLDDTGMSYFWGKLKTYFQPTLVSGTNIKTINNESVLGSGNIQVSSSTETASYSGITAYRSGNVVTLVVSASVTASAAGWKTIDTIGEKFRPPTQEYAVGYNNNDSSWNASRPVMMAVSTVGNVNVYLFSDKLTVAPKATITYVV